MEIRANFVALEDLEGRIRRTVEAVGEEMATWQQATGVALTDWQDVAGTEFEGVSTAWLRLTELQNTFLTELGFAVGNANNEMQGALQQARALVGGTAL
ncbi:hypothetical protein O7627_21420 [Solwaraspora sp. WMMD1047]|uniref:hypothetical protein n=1 Tax=Solwaraspora sp. WMMD1047 TaxID=3016102 RepID=UPI0024165150|nr:hypothetical protein [Solwaraspora sp. WMMD1047]MDG4831844.1 hypothetical protein [Solwaraspora sp. WMMD1047]